MRLLPVLGGALLILSSVLAWAEFAGPSGFPGYYVTQMPILHLLTGSLQITALAASLALIITVFGLAAAGIALLWPGSRRVDLTRRVLGTLTALLVVLFLVRVARAPGSLFPSLRAGFYLAALGSLITILTGRRLRAP